MTHKNNPKATFVTLLTTLIIYSVFIIFFFHYERLTGDATLYLSIAEKYLRADFSNAINGYWGPLLSWLLIPFLYLGSTHVFAINALNLIFGLLTITGVWRLSFRFEISDRIRNTILPALVPILLFVSLSQPMDFLLLCVLIFYLIIIFRDDYPSTVFNALLCGFTGALAYFSKPYGFPFFIAHFSLMNISHYLRTSSAEHRKKVIRNTVAGFIIFAILSGVWIILISNKYNHLTFSNMGRGVFASLGPESAHDTLEKGDPIFFKGFFEPPNETAFVIYEDPSYARKETWSPLESWSLFKHFINNFSKNIFEGFRIYQSFSRLSITIIIAYILLITAQPIKKIFLRTDMLYPFLTVILYTGGYTLFHFEKRYLWIVNILLLLMGCKVLNVIFQNDFFRSEPRKTLLTGFFILSFIITPIKFTIETSQYNINRKMYELGTKLDKRYNIRGNIASNRQKNNIEIFDSWHNTFRLAYWLKSRYYGMDRKNISNEELKNELRKYNIDYYFFWDTSGDIPEFLSKYKEITGGEIPFLKIYSLNEKT